MASLPYESYGWEWSNELSMVVPVWFVGHQLTKDLRSKKKKDAINIDADDEGDDEESVRSAKRKKKSCISEAADNGQQISESEIYNADIDTLNTIETTESYKENDSEEENWDVSDFASSNDSSDECTPDK